MRQRREYVRTRISRPAWLAAFLLGMAGAVGCDETFQPTEPNEVKFSVYGYLDASADTQWIRVMPMRTLVTTSPDPLGATVTLENVATGRIIELRDSLFRLGVPDEVGSGARYFHNFWTTERIEPGSSYRFSVASSGEEPARAVIHVPGDYQTEVWIGQAQRRGTDFLWLGGLRHVAFVSAMTYFYDACGSFSQRVMFPYTSIEADAQAVPVNSRLQARPGCGPPVVEKRELWMAGSGSAWPSGREYQTNRLGTPTDSSSISHSIGFLGGVLTKVVPYETCLIMVAGPLMEPCKLRYDAASATLVGRARDALCGGGALTNVVVRLQEIDSRPNARPKLRPLMTNRSGDFEIGALEVGMQYELTLSRLDDSAPPEDEFETYADTLEFAPAERRLYDAPLKRIKPCRPQP